MAASGAAPEAVPTRASGGVLSDLCSSGIGHLLAARFLQIAAILVCYPWLPSLMTDLFASRAAGEPMRCANLDPQPAECQDAHAQAVQWSAVSALVSTAGVSLVVTPLIGRASDLRGRKPFILLGMLAGLPPFAALLLVTRGALPLPAYYVLSALCDGVTSMAPGQAYVSDVVPPERRAAAFGLITAVLSVALLLGPLLAQPMPDEETAIAFALIGMSAAAAWVALALPESLPASARAAERTRRAAVKASTARGCDAGMRAALSAPFLGLRVACRSPLFRRLTLLVVLCALAGDALSDVTGQYLQMAIGFGPRQQAALLMVYGISGIIVQGVVLRPLLRVAGERGAATVGCACFTARLLLMTSARPTAALAFTAAAVGTGAELVFPAVSALKANNAGAQEQGLVQGGLFAARSLATGAGPLPVRALRGA
jgi:DHA1 family tetracycline resistance protein-like MFS transporter